MSLPRSPQPAKKGARKKPVAEWQSWEKTAIDRRFRIITIILAVLAIPTVATIAYLFRNIIAERMLKMEQRPTLISSRSPELLQHFTCNIKSGFHSGDFQTFVRNIGSVRAMNVIPDFTLRVVPERKVGIPEFDEIPSGDCSAKGRGTPTSPIPPGQETTLFLREPLTKLPPLLDGEAAQLYGVSCLRYSDPHGTPHAACDTYRLRLVTGASVFICDGQPQTGTFDPEPVSNCSR